GLAWVLLGCAEQLEWFSRPCVQFEGKTAFLREMERAARATADFYLRHSSADGIPFWDTGAPGLAGVTDYAKTSDPWSGPEPVDSSAAAISAQGLIRLGLRLGGRGSGYLRAGLGVARTLFSPPYLAEAPKHEGLLLHSVYHRPRGWDYVPKGRTIPCGESSLWGDYHALELAVLVKRLARRESPVTFFAGG
ncbi:MAG TPA: glycosyl hydrolase, partial [Candidatus Hydrogenedentes bacterium]|nr:glycosyl hydrolase [Candidatus Hydrogenedentota bacterium]